jgi:hypothetical protein
MFSIAIAHAKPRRLSTKGTEGCDRILP